MLKYTINFLALIMSVKILGFVALFATIPAAVIMNTYYKIKGE